MWHSRGVEIAVGVFVALGLAALVMLAMQVSNLASYSDAEGYELQAHFDNVGGLKVRSPVTMSGVTVGRVKHIDFDDHVYQAVVTLTINGNYRRIPEDTFANIYTAGLLGEQYISLDPGGSMDFLKEGDQLLQTQSALILEQMIGKFLFDKASSDFEPAAPPPPGPGGPTPAKPALADPLGGF